MNLDARSITIGLSVVLLVAIGWVLVANSEDDPGETTVAAVTTASSTTSGAATTVATTATVPSTTTAASTTSVGTTTTIATATTTTAPSTTSGPTRSTVTISPPLEEPDLTLCRENDIPDRQCRWVGVEYPKITADPEVEPLLWLREYADFLDWSSANPSLGRDLMHVAETGVRLTNSNEQLDAWREEQRLYLSRTSVEEPLEVREVTDDEAQFTAIVVPGEGSMIVRGEEETTGEIPTRTWQFDLLRTDEGWRVARMEPVE